MITATGVLISLSRDMSDAWEVGGIDTAEYSFYVKGLTPDTKYYLQAWATNEYGTGYSDVTLAVTAADKPNVIAVGYTNITQTSATVTVKASGGYYNITSYTFKLYASDGTLISTDTTLVNHITYSNLTAGTQYSVGVIVTNTNGDSSSEYDAGSFKTVALLPVVTITSFTASSPTKGMVAYNISSTEKIWAASLYIDTNSDFSTATEIKLTAQAGSGTQNVAILDTTKTYYTKVWCETLSGLEGTSSVASIEPLANVTITNITSTGDSATITISIS